MAEHPPAAHRAADVDEDGRPEGPQGIAAEKRKKRNIAYFGIALAAGGIVVAIVLARRNAAAAQSAQSAQSSYQYPQLPGAASSGVPSGSDISAGLGSIQAQFAATAAAQATAQAALLAELQKIEKGQKTVPAPKPKPIPNPGQATKKPPLLSTWFPRTESAGAILNLGGAHQAGLQHVSGGAPTYALQHGQWTQGFDYAHLPAGTPIGTLKGLNQYVF